MTSKINLSLQGVNLHLESSPSLTFDEFLSSLGDFSQSSPSAYKLAGSSEAKRKMSLKVPPGVFLDISIKGGILSINSLQGSHQINVIDGELMLLGSRGSLELELESSKALLLNSEGFLRARLSESFMENRASFQESWMHMVDSQMRFFHDGKLEGKLEIQGRESEIFISPDYKESLMVQAEANDFHHFGANGKFFITSLGRQKYFGFLEDLKANELANKGASRNNLLVAEEILRESEDLINLFDQYEDQIESMYDDLGPQAINEEPASPQKNHTDRERYLLALAREGKISIEDLEKLLNEDST